MSMYANYVSSRALAHIGPEWRYTFGLHTLRKELPGDDVGSMRRPSDQLSNTPVQGQSLPLAKSHLVGDNVQHTMQLLSC